MLSRMTEPVGLRERKKARVRETIAATAIRMFLESGFDQVSITDIAREADVSRRTLFAYFPTKEDLVLQRFADHEDEAARIVRARRPDQPPLDALREALLDRLRQRDPSTGLNDDPEIIAFLQLISGTESLAAQADALHRTWHRRPGRSAGRERFRSAHRASHGRPGDRGRA